MNTNLKSVCILLLLCIINPLFSQEIETTIQQTDNISSQPIQDNLSLISYQSEDQSLEGIQTRACVSSYTNQTVSSTTSVVGCSTLAVQTVTVTANGNLSLSAPGNITINGTIEVKGGGLLNVFYSNPPRNVTVQYTYDRSGNRNSRLITLTRSARQTTNELAKTMNEENEENVDQ